jgi:hypothetical protein
MAKGEADEAAKGKVSSCGNSRFLRNLGIYSTAFAVFCPFYSPSDPILAIIGCLAQKVSASSRGSE